MDIKVNQLQQTAPVQQTKQAQPTDGTFKFTLVSHIEEQELQARLTNLMEEITMQGEKILIYFYIHFDPCPLSHVCKSALCLQLSGYLYKFPFKYNIISRKHSCKSLLTNFFVIPAAFRTRPIRAGEKNGMEYFFTDEDRFLELKEAGRDGTSRYTLDVPVFFPDPSPVAA